jgi:hypothetical protein
MNPSNDTAVVGAYNRLYVFSLNNSTGVWQHMAVKQVCVLILLQTHWPPHAHATCQLQEDQPYGGCNCGSN